MSRSLVRAINENVFLLGHPNTYVRVLRKQLTFCYLSHGFCLKNNQNKVTKSRQGRKDKGWIDASKNN